MRSRLPSWPPAIESAQATISPVSLDSLGEAATRAIAARAALRYGSASCVQRSSARAMREASCGLKASISSTRSAQKA
jgi:hypothetical protein